MTDIHKPSQLTTENKLQQSQKFTENTLKSAKKILEIAVNCVILLEEHKISPETVSSYKLQLSKLQHELEVREIQSEESAMLSPMYVQSIKNKIIQYTQNKEYALLAQELVKTRVEILLVPQSKRHSLINVLVENDLFGGNLNGILNLQNHSVCSSTMAIVSMLCSIEPGQNYVLGNNTVNICSLLINLLETQEMNSVCQRFIIASLEKLSLNDAATLWIIEHQLIE